MTAMIADRRSPVTTAGREDGKTTLCNNSRLLHPIERAASKRSGSTFLAPYRALITTGHTQAKVTRKYCIPIPSPKTTIPTGINETDGIGRRNSTTCRVTASTQRETPISRPSGSPMTTAQRNPRAVAWIEANNGSTNSPFMSPEKRTLNISGTEAVADPGSTPRIRASSQSKAQAMKPTAGGQRESRGRQRVPADPAAAPPTRCGHAGGGAHVRWDVARIGLDRHGDRADEGRGWAAAGRVEETGFRGRHPVGHRGFPALAR